MLKSLLVVALLTLALARADAQIYFQNPSFEADSSTAPCMYCVPTHWAKCYGGIEFIYDSTAEAGIPEALNNLGATDGHFFTFLNAASISFGANAQVGLFQELGCSLKPNRTYRFAVDCMPLLTNYPGGPAANYLGHGELQIIGSNDSCQIGELMFDAYDSDTAWHTVSVTFTPTQEWNFLFLKMKQLTGENSQDCIDNLSPIQCLNYNEVQALTNDTTVAAGSCITLNAQTSGAYDSVYWKISNGTIISNALVDVQVCPTTSTDYVVCMRSTDCGNFWSYDTVHVEIPNSIPATKPFEFSLTPTLNCNAQPFHLSANSSGTLDIFNVAGKSVKRLNFPANRIDFTLDGLPDGVYLYRVVSQRGVAAGKLVLGRCR